MISLTDYAEVLGNQAKTNKMSEAMELFKSLKSFKNFVNTPFVVLLNKSDLFAERLMTTSFTVYNSEMDIEDSKDYDTCLESVKTEVFQIGEAAGGGSVKCYVTNATDTELIKSMFDEVAKSILDGNVAGSF